MDLYRGLTRVRAHIEAKRVPLTLEALARMAGMSPFHFQRLHRRCYGESAHAYLRRLRLARAHDLLESGRCNVTEACEAVGFASVGSFSRQFRAQFGFSPSRLQMRKPG